MNERGARLFRLAVLLLTVALLAARPPLTDDPRAVDDPTRLLSAPPRVSRAAMPRAFAFPRDHAPHPDYQTEWWYFTGHLADADGREFGFQMTFFRFELAPRCHRRPRPAHAASGSAISPSATSPHAASTPTSASPAAIPRWRQSPSNRCTCGRRLGDHLPGETAETFVPRTITGRCVRTPRRRLSNSRW